MARDYFEAHEALEDPWREMERGEAWADVLQGLIQLAVALEHLKRDNSLGAFKYVDHIRAWSLMDICMREDRKRWLEVLSYLRYGDEEGAALKEGMGLTPDQFNSRWVDRMRGKRKTMGETKRDLRTDPDEPGRVEREQIRTTQEPEILAGRIRGADHGRHQAT